MRENMDQRKFVFWYILRSVLYIPGSLKQCKQQDIVADTKNNHESMTNNLNNDINVGFSGDKEIFYTLRKHKFWNISVETAGKAGQTTKSHSWLIFSYIQFSMETTQTKQSYDCH